MQNARSCSDTARDVQEGLQVPAGVVLVNGGFLMFLGLVAHLVCEAVFLSVAVASSEVPEPPLNQSTVAKEAVLVT